MTSRPSERMGFCALHGKRVRASSICPDYEPKEGIISCPCEHYDEDTGLCLLLGDLAPCEFDGICWLDAECSTCKYWREADP